MMLVLAQCILSFTFLNLFYLLLLLLSVAYFTLLERKLMASVQRRTGPRIVGFYGILQPLIDGIKLLLKEIIVPQKSNKLLFLAAPLISLLLSFCGWSVIPFDAISVIANLDFGLLYIFGLSSLNVYGLILSGWSSNSKYAFLGALRSTAQVISYELIISFIILIIIMFAGSFNFMEIVLMQKQTVWFIIPCLPLAIMFFICMLAETNRIPFDLAEAEAELVAGYNIEYSSMTFAMFFLAEYSNMLLLSAIFSLIFLGGWLSPFSFLSDSSFWFCFKIVCFAILFVLIRASLPRFRYDQLMNVGWKSLLPLIFGFFLFYLGSAVFLQCTPLKFSLLYVLQH